MNQRYLLIGPRGLQFSEVWKHEDEEIDVTFDWSRQLAGDTIVSSVWATPDAWTEPKASEIDVTLTKTVVWLAGGVKGSFGLLVNTIVTTGGRKLQAYCLAHVAEDDLP